MQRWNSMLPVDLCRLYAEQGLWLETDTVLGHFSQNVERNPDKAAFIDYRKGKDRRSISYLELDRIRRSWAAYFTSLGIKRGDVISFQLPNWWEFAGLYLACETVGAVANPLMPIFRDMELEVTLGLGGSRIFIVPTEYRGFQFGPMAHSLKARLPNLEHVFTIEQFARNADLDVDRAAAADSKPIAANEVCELLYTSGTTGVPKGVMHTGNTLFAALRPFIAALELTQADVVFMGSPLGHQTGFLYGLVLPLSLGATGVFQDVWDGDTAIKVIEKERATFTMASTPFLTDVAKSSMVVGRDLSRFRYFICGGAPIPRDLVQRGGELLGAKILSIWGMTECGIGTLVRPQDPAECAFTSDGIAMAGYEVRVVDHHGTPAPVSIEGELQVRSASCAVGYLGRPDLFSMNADGWFSSGDLACVDANGYIRITGRSKDIIIRGGENVPVVEVEMALIKHEAVQDISVVAMPDERLGERGCAFVVVAPNAQFDMAAMQQYLAGLGMAKNYWPEHVEIVSELPRTPSGKIKKFELRERAAKIRRTQ